MDEILNALYEARRAWDTGRTEDSIATINKLTIKVENMVKNGVSLKRSKKPKK